MLDHIGYPVADIGRSKNFYGAALAPLAVTIIMEVTAEQTFVLDPDGNDIEVVCHAPA
jgi:catechol 2,3-dioxygenase-like lactoylglutathione lyase family enzyme